MMPPTIFSITITHPPCREGRVNHRPHPQLRRIKCQIYHIWYRYLMFDRPSPPLRRINYQIYYIWCRYLIFDRPSPWLWRMPTRNLLFAFSSLSLPSWSDQCFFYVRKVINSGLHVIYQQEFISWDSGSLILKIQMRCFFYISGSKILKSAKARISKFSGIRILKYFRNLDP